MLSALSSKEFFNFLNYDSSKEVWDIIDMIHRGSQNIEQERMTKVIHKVRVPIEYESHSHWWYSNIWILWGYIRNCLSNNYLIIKSWNQKTDSILNSKDGSAFVIFKKNLKEGDH